MQQAHWTRDWAAQLASGAEALTLEAIDAEARLDEALRDNHRWNFLLWQQEDQARRDDLGPEHVRRAKRAIDSYNQRRNDCVERLDQALLEALPAATEDAPAHSETPGMMLDRLSILALKVFYMGEQVERAGASEAHRARCRSKLEVLHRQRGDLLDCLVALLDAVAVGQRRFRVYFQFKMYNDPELNPLLKAGTPAAP